MYYTTVYSKVGHIMMIRRFRRYRRYNINSLFFCNRQLLFGAALTSIRSRSINEMYVDIIMYMYFTCIVSAY